MLEDGEQINIINPSKFVFLNFLLAHYISALKPVKDIIQQDLKFVDLHFVKSE